MTDLFDQQTVEEKPQLDESQNYYEKLVGPSAKFKDNESLAKGKWYSDQMIEIQNRKLDQMRNQILEQDAQLKAAKRLEDLLDQYDKRQAQTPIEAPEVDVRDNKPAISPEDVESIIAKKIAESKSADQAKQNFDIVTSKLKERYGPNYRDILLEKTEELGLSTDDANALARRSPQAFFKTMGLDQAPQQGSPQTPPRSSAQFAPVGAPKKTWSYYQNLYKKDPKLYYDPKMTQEMVESHVQLGSEFEDGDFRRFGDSLGRVT